MGLGYLFALCAAMFSGAFIAGSVPLLFAFSESRLVLVSTFGSGLLVGTAMTVILPEGVETLYSAATLSQDSHSSRKNLVTASESHSSPVRNIPSDKAKLSQRPDPIQENTPAKKAASDESNPNNKEKEGGPLDGLRRRIDRDNEPNNNQKVDPAIEIKSSSQNTHSEHSEHRNHNHEKAHYEPSKYIGPPLILGFLFMLLIDQLGAASGGHAHSHTAPAQHNQTRRVSASGLPLHHPHTDDKVETVSASSASAASSNHDHSGHGNSGGNMASATVGLVVHAAADGIALGAALTSDQGNLGFIVFLAIMLHKAPSAFGLTTHLLKTMDSKRGGISTRAKVRSHLLLFSLAAPIGAILTFCILSQLGFEDAIAMRIYTGVALLFSAGTFLYVATVHVLPEIYEDGRLSGAQTAALIVGMFVPMLMTVEHSH
ncbi:hypothetical protein HDU77_003988 [Chytriomyces hyalinus]|nr:hypothetical protein HDU77_003988 [Chytriomyces hyalinus]